jgi:hypothetical protein
LLEEPESDEVSAFGFGQSCVEQGKSHHSPVLTVTQELLGVVGTLAIQEKHDGALVVLPLPEVKTLISRIVLVL